MKVLLLNGSPRAGGNTAMALKEMEEIFTREGIEWGCVELRLYETELCRG